MAEPTTLNTTLAVAAVASLGPLAGEYALIVLGAFGGALLALQRVKDPMPKWWQPLTHVGSNVTAALLFTGVASSVVAKLLPDAWGISIDMLWVPIAAAVAMYWRDAAGAVPALVRSWAGRNTGGQP